MKRRSEVNIYFDILNLVKQPVVATKVMQKSNLSFKLWKQYRDYLLKLGVIGTEQVGKRQTRVFITEEGKELLKYIEQNEVLKKIVYGGK